MSAVRQQNVKVKNNTVSIYSALLYDTSGSSMNVYQISVLGTQRDEDLTQND